MDPDANLTEQRRLVARLLNQEPPHLADYLRLAELVDALDEWLQKGGALPREWARHCHR